MHAHVMYVLQQICASLPQGPVVTDNGNLILDWKFTASKVGQNLHHQSSGNRMLHTHA